MSNESTDIIQGMKWLVSGWYAIEFFRGKRNNDQMPKKIGTFLALVDKRTF